MEIRDKANSYASAKTNEVMIQAIAQAYMDGYQDGYKDYKEQIPLDFLSDIIEYVDLGLPSGTLWAADYEKEDGKIVYLPYDKASILQIPTEEQWKELLETCRWEYVKGKKSNHFVGVGPNGESICFDEQIGYFKHIDYVFELGIRFWINDGSAELDKNSVIMSYWNCRQHKEITKTFKGYKLPIRLVRT